MRFLHTADWHLDRALRGRNRRDEYESALLEVLDIALRESVDALLIAGDVFDSMAPTAEAERLFYQGFLAPLHRSGIRAVIVAGNHDHPLRLGAIKDLLSLLNVEVIPTPLSPQAGG